MKNSAKFGTHLTGCATLGCGIKGADEGSKTTLAVQLCAGECGQAKPRSEYYKGHAKCKACYALHLRKDPTFKARRAAAEARRRAKNPPVYDRWQRILKTYGLTQEQFNELAQGGCNLCHDEGKLVVDHCHDTGRVRGVLCISCNAAIGKLGDTPEALRRAADYLEPK